MDNVKVRAGVAFLMAAITLGIAIFVLSYTINPSPSDVPLQAVPESGALEQVVPISGAQVEL